jgi:Ricin-type beta-trefoil lectin domain
MGNRRTQVRPSCPSPHHILAPILLPTPYGGCEIAKSMEIKMLRVNLSLVSVAIAASIAAVAGAPTSALAGQTSNQGEILAFGSNANTNRVSSCLNAGTGVPQRGSALYSNSCTEGNGQQQTFGVRGDMYGPGQEITIASLCVVPSGLSNGASVVLKPCIGTEAQNWVFDDGTFHYGANGAYCLDVNHGNTNSGTPVDVAICNGTEAQFWVPSGFTFTIHSTVSLPGKGLCLDDYGNEYGNDERVDDGTCNGTMAQVWSLVYGGPPSQLSLENEGGYVCNGCSFDGPMALQADSPENGHAGQVYLTHAGGTGLVVEQTSTWGEPNSVSGVSFVGSDAFSTTGYDGSPDVGCLDVYGGSSTPNTTVDQWWCNGTYAQIWHLELTG